MIVFLGWLIFSGLVGYAASQRGRSGGGWFLITALISPLIAFVVLMLIDDLQVQGLKVQEEAQRQQGLLEQQGIEQKRLAYEQSTVNTDSFIERLEKFARLHHHDMLTEAEFRDRKNVVISELTQKRLSKSPEDFLYDIILLKDTGVLDDSDVQRIKTIVL